jgi:hypothetical protein
MRSRDLSRGRACSCFLLLGPAYVGPGPGLEYTGQFVTLLVLVGLALAALLLWPLSVLLRRLWSGKKKEPEDPALSEPGGYPDPSGSEVGRRAAE